MAEKLRPSQKILVISNLDTTGPLWVMSLEKLLLVDVIFETNPNNTLTRWAAEIPDLIIIDVKLPTTSLFGLIKALRFETVTPILLLTSNATEEFLVEAYQNGVDECVLKPVGSSLFQAKTRAWLRRTGNIPVETLDPLRAGGLQLFPTEQILTLANGAIIRLTNLEIRLLYCLMSQPGRTVATEGLVQRVWGSTFEADSSVLKNIVYRLRKKIEPDPSHPQIIQTVVGVGYRLTV
jgi:DNA-binding response OmpR family regulator